MENLTIKEKMAIVKAMGASAAAYYDNISGNWSIRKGAITIKTALDIKPVESGWYSIKALNAGIVSLLAEDDNSGNMAIPAIPGDMIPIPKNSNFRNAFKKVYPYASKDVTRLVIQGIYIDSVNDTIVATDGQTLSYIHDPIASAITSEPVIIPADKSILSIFKGKYDFSIVANSEATWIKAGDTILYTLNYTGIYPSYRKVISDMTEHSILRLPDKNSVAEMIKASKALELQCCHIVFESDRVYLFDHPSIFTFLDNSQLPESLHKVTLRGELLKRVIDTGVTQLDISDKYKPLRGQTADGITVLIMPMRIE